MPKQLILLKVWDPSLIWITEMTSDTIIITDYNSVHKLKIIELSQST